MHGTRPSRRQRHEEIGLGVEALDQLRSELYEKLRQRSERRPIGKRIHEPVEAKRKIGEAGLGEWRGLPTPRRGHAKASLAKREQEGNAEAMIFSADAKNMGGQGSRLAVARGRDSPLARAIDAMVKAEQPWRMIQARSAMILSSTLVCK